MDIIFLFADDQVVMASNELGAAYMVRKLVEEYDWGLKINTTKTEYFVIGEATGNIQLEDKTETNKCNKYKYLGIIISQVGKCEDDHRVTKGISAIQKFNYLLWSTQMTIRTKLKN